MLKKLTSLLATVLLVGSLSANVSATNVQTDTVSVEQFRDKFGEEVVYYVDGEPVYLHVETNKMTDNEIAHLAEYMSENNLNTIEELANSLGLVTEAEKFVKEVEVEPIRVRLGDSARISDGYYTDECYDIKDLDFGHLGYLYFDVWLQIEVEVRSGKIVRVSDTDFDTIGLDSHGSISHLRTPNYVASNGMNAGVTANYDVTKTIDFPVDDNFGLPLSATKNEITSLIYYLD